MNDTKICFAHNVTFREKPVRHTISIEKELFPNATFCIASDGDSFIFDEGIDFEVYGPPQGHKVGCVNSAWHALKMALRQDADIICFSHDDIYISDAAQMIKCVDLLKNGYEFVGRQHRGVCSYTAETSPEYFDKYIMIENFMLTRQLAQRIVENVTPFPPNRPDLLPVDCRQSPCCEIAFGQSVLKNTEKAFLFSFIHNHFDRTNEMGYYHVGNPRGWVD